jgi:hypothetical protein
MSSNAERDIGCLLIDLHVKAIHVEEQSGCFSTGSFVPIVENVASNNLPTDSSCLFKYCGVKVLPENGTLDRLKYML